MSEKVKFHNMTKPIRFRKFKLFLKSVGLTYEVGKERINYLFNYLLYKLNILNRYSYRDNVEKVTPLPPQIPLKTIKTDWIEAVLESEIVENNFIDVDYFYRVKKDGSKKRTYVISDYDRKEITLHSRLKDIQIKVGDSWFSTCNLPTFNLLTFSPEDLKPISLSDMDNEKLIRPNYITMECDLTLLTNLRSRTLLSLESTYLDLLKYTYEQDFNKFQNRLKGISLSDILIGGNRNELS